MLGLRVLDDRSEGPGMRAVATWAFEVALAAPAGCPGQQSSHLLSMRAGLPAAKAARGVSPWDVFGGRRVVRL
jgi:hypothetical protein